MERTPEFDVFFESHIRKIVALRGNDADDRRRYVSKNNLKVARLTVRPPPPLADGTFVIRFRERVHQAASMLRQHRRFLEIHERDDFVREYMEAIGRHEFGKGLKPVDFGGWMGEARFPDELALWVRYWVAGYWFVLEQAGEDVVLVSYARLTEEPGAALERLAEALDLSTPELTSLAGPLRPPRTHDAPTAAVADSVLDQADRTHERLRRRADV